MKQEGEDETGGIKENNNERREHKGREEGDSEHLETPRKMSKYMGKNWVRIEVPSMKQLVYDDH